MGMPTYKLIYFNGRGAAERTRIMFAIKKVEYEDFRYEVTFANPGDPTTAERPEFERDKAAGKFTANLGELPILEVDGVQIGQSKAIERYVAKAIGMMGSTALEEAQIDAICEHQVL